MDYSLLLIIAKNDKHVQKVLGDFRGGLASSGNSPTSFYFYTRSKNYVIAVGLIDYLQIFNFQKNVQGKAQRFLQALKKKPKSEISCVEPLAYHERFNTGLGKIFKIA